MCVEKKNIKDFLSIASNESSKKRSYPRSYSFAVVGATGIVGQELLSILASQRIPYSEVRAIASQTSAGQKIAFGDQELVVQALGEDSFAGVDVAFFSVSNELAKKYIPIAVNAGAVCVDKSSAFRMHKDVPLVVPEVNESEIQDFAKRRIVASPNCTASPLLQVLSPLSRVAKIKRVVVSSYQAVSGAGRDGMDELDQQTRDLFNLRDLEAKVFKQRIAFNLLPCIPASGEFDEYGNTEEEQKVIEETRKVLGLPDLKIAVTCVRVPVFNAHSEAVNIEFESEISVKKARDVLANASGVVVIDDTSTLLFPTPADATGEDYTLVGRIRGDNSVQHGISLWLTSDNLRTGAALNAVRIAESLCSNYLK